MSKSRCMLAAVIGMMGALLAEASAAIASEPEMKPIGGRWYVAIDERPNYLYRDADRFVDLFSYHQFRVVE